MSKKNKKAKRSPQSLGKRPAWACSVCRKTGHYARTCKKKGKK